VFLRLPPFALARQARGQPQVFLRLPPFALARQARGQPQVFLRLPPGRSALPKPAKPGLCRRRGPLMLTIAPVAARALLVPLCPTFRADHSGSDASQAALARRMRRRRSEERSSSFRPPQVPYFSGLLTA